MCNMMARNDADQWDSLTQGEFIAYDRETNRNAAPARSTDGQKTRHGALVKRLSRYGMHILPNSLARRSGIQRQPEVTDCTTADSLGRLPTDAPERGSLTSAMRKRYLKELLFSNTSNIGFGGVLTSTETASASLREEQDPQRTDLVLYPMEHAWMLSAVDGNYEAIFEFIAHYPCLLTRKDFISGFSVLHWLAKKGDCETLHKLLRHAKDVGMPADVNLKGSGGLTPLHVASMHSQYMVIKLLVGAFGANVDVMDYNGKRAWQYLKGNAPLEIQELLDTWDEDHHNTSCAQNASSNGAQCSPSQTTPAEDEVLTLDRNTRAGSWRLKYFRDLLPPYLFGNKC